MALIPAPGRQFKTISMVLLILTGLGDLATVLLQSLSDMHISHWEDIAIAHTVMIFVIGAARFFQQQIALTTEQKTDLIASAAAAPVKDGHTDVVVTVTSADAALPVAPPPSIQVTPATTEAAAAEQSRDFAQQVDVSTLPPNEVPTRTPDLPATTSVITQPDPAVIVSNTTDPVVVVPTEKRIEP